MKIDDDREYDYHLKLVSSPCDLEYQSDLEYQISNQVLGESITRGRYFCNKMGCSFTSYSNIDVDAVLR